MLSGFNTLTSVSTDTPYNNTDNKNVKWKYSHSLNLFIDWLFLYQWFTQVTLILNTKDPYQVRDYFINIFCFSAETFIAKIRFRNRTRLHNMLWTHLYKDKIVNENVNASYIFFLLFSKASDMYLFLCLTILVFSVGIFWCKSTLIHLVFS